MSVRLPSPAKDVNRNRRAHRKSRQGCGNCKLRRVKVSRYILQLRKRPLPESRMQCDESKPRCARCIAYGVACNYDPKSPDLQLSVDGAFNIKVPQRLPCSLNQTILSMINAPLSLQSTESPESSAAYQLDGQRPGAAKQVPDKNGSYHWHKKKVSTFTKMRS